MAEPLKATFFTLQHRDRAVLLPATLVLLVGLVVMIGAFAAINWGMISRMFALLQQFPGGPEVLTEADGMAMFQGMMLMFLSMILLLFPMYLLIAAYEAACLRWMIRGEVKGFAGFALDHDTWRVYGVYWCWYILQFLVSFAASIIMMPVIFMTMPGLVTGDGAIDHEQMWRWQLSVQLPLSLVQYIPLLFFGVRFAPSAAVSIARRRFSFLEAWPVTRGRFWALLGSFALLMLINGAAMALVMGAAYWVLFSAMLTQWFADGWPMSGGFPDVTDQQIAQLMQQVFRPQTFMVLGALYAALLLITLVYTLLSYGVNARAALVALEEGKIEQLPPTD
ncbi:hypothetical protein [Vitreimonas flagellata]|uniref:hypothetical protein n=1 Tax=Vitreimonas flagellata TaxID=2560861 RepID=UPI00107534E5|nr:hypothetical protein [Vitreimonas flagellata]